MELLGNCVFLGFEQKTFNRDKESRSWLVVNLADQETGKAIEVNADMEQLDMVSVMRRFVPAKVVLKLVPRKDKGMAVVLKAIVPADLGKEAENGKK